MDEQYKNAVREVLEQRGRPVKFANGGEPDRWGRKRVSTFGWTNWDVQKHITVGECRWVIPPGSPVTETEYSQFVGTFTDNKEEVGLNVEGAHCACARYTGVTLRYVGTLGEILHEILKVPDSEPDFRL